MEYITKETKALVQNDVQEAIKYLEKEYPRGVELIYIDYRDCIEDAKDREAILQDPDNAWEIMDSNNWTSESQWESIRYILDEYINSLSKGQEDKVELSDEVVEAMREWLYENDTSDPLKGLLKNTGNEYMYYDTGIEIESLDYHQSDEKYVSKTAKMIMKKLKLEQPEHQKGIEMMIEQAWDGGQLVILFEASIGDFMEDTKYIKFKDKAELCIMNRGNGSGDNTALHQELLFKFKRGNIHTDKGDNGYSYAYDVCGLVGGIMNDGFLTNKKGSASAISVDTNEQREAQRATEARYIESWKAGKCSAGDMNIKRHKNTPYRNDYPCGNKCEECGTFWVD